MLVAPCGRVLGTGAVGVGGWVLAWLGSVGVGVIVLPPGATLACAVSVIPWLETTLALDSAALQAGRRWASGTTAARAISATMATKTPTSAVRSRNSCDSDIGRDDT